MIVLEILRFGFNYIQMIRLITIFIFFLFLSNKHNIDEGASCLDPWASLIWTEILALVLGENGQHFASLAGRRDVQFQLLL